MKNEYKYKVTKILKTNTFKEPVDTTSYFNYIRSTEYKIEEFKCNTLADVIVYLGKKLHLAGVKQGKESALFLNNYSVLDTKNNIELLSTKADIYYDKYINNKYIPVNLITRHTIANNKINDLVSDKRFIVDYRYINKEFTRLNYENDITLQVSLVGYETYKYIFENYYYLEQVSFFSFRSDIRKLINGSINYDCRYVGRIEYNITTHTETSNITSNYTEMQNKTKTFDYNHYYRGYHKPKELAYSRDKEIAPYLKTRQKNLTTKSTYYKRSRHRVPYASWKKVSKFAKKQYSKYTYKPHYTKLSKEYFNKVTLVDEINNTDQYLAEDFVYWVD